MGLNHDGAYLIAIVIVKVLVEVCIMHAAGTGLPGGEGGGARSV